MANYNLTAGNDVLIGTEGADTFDGVVNGVTGGTDTLDGGGGNDNFIIGADLSINGGSIDGGAGTDTVTLHDEFARINSIHQHGNPRLQRSVDQL